MCRAESVGPTISNQKGINMTEANTSTNATPTAAQPTVAPKLTHDQKLRQKFNTLCARITTDTEAANAIAEELRGIAALASVQAGDTVIVKLGRADTAREEVGTVLAVRETDDGAKQYKVQYGVDFDAEIAVVGSAKISLPPAAECEPAIECEPAVEG
jgi:hypothetical protein